MDKIPEKTFSQRRHMDNQQPHEKIFNITNNQRNMNKNHNELSPQLPERPSSKRPLITNVGTDAEKKKNKTLYTLDGNINWYSHCGKHEVFLKKLEMQLPYDPAIQPLGIYPKKMKTLI